MRRRMVGLRADGLHWVQLRCMRSSPKTTFAQRLRSTAIFWGPPCMLVELAGVPRRSWGLVLLIAFPATIVGVIASSLMEHGAVRFIQRYWMDDESSPR